MLFRNRFLIFIIVIILNILFIQKSMAALEFQPGPEGTDVWITNIYSYNDDYGVNDQGLKVGGWGDYYNSLIKFDLSSLPKQATSAFLQLYSADYGLAPTSMYLDKVTSTWDENTGWYTKPNYTYQRTISAPVVNTQYSIDITDIYNSWQNGKDSNYGIQLRPVSNQGNCSYFYSSDYMANPTLRPKLVITDATPPTPPPQLPPVAERSGRYALITGMSDKVEFVANMLKNAGWNIIKKGNQLFDSKWISDLESKNPSELLFYFGGHGTWSETNKGDNLAGSFLAIGNRTINVVDYASDEGLLYVQGDQKVALWDKDLTALFNKPSWENIHKTFILDSCLAGGFIGGGNGDLDSLQNYTLIAAAREDELVGLYDNNETTLTNWYLKRAIVDKMADFNRDNIITWEELKKFFDLTEGISFENAHILGEFDYNSLYNGTQTPIFVSNLSEDGMKYEFTSNTVPEPATMLLLGLGLMGLAGIRRKFKN